LAASSALTKSDVVLALADISELSAAEYGIGIESLLLLPDSSLRLQRLSGILLKRKFAAAGPPGSSLTGARFSWRWIPASFEFPPADSTREFALLNALRMPGSWNEIKPCPAPSTIGSQYPGAHFKVTPRVSADCSKSSISRCRPLIEPASKHTSSVLGCAGVAPIRGRLGSRYCDIRCRYHRSPSKYCGRTDTRSGYRIDKHSIWLSAINDVNTDRIGDASR
jgi:hypothetical protein